jgi:peptidyl-tRNA hydrolase, PTH1 family
MALLQKKPITTTTLPLYTTGQQLTYLIIGLGNIGKKYEHTRHNVGFSVVDALQKDLSFPEWQEKKDLCCNITSAAIGTAKIFLIKPTTFMNESGRAASAVTRYFKIPLERMVVVHDELAIPFGSIRTRVGGSSGGHNGISSIINALGEEFGRVRIGIHNSVCDKPSFDSAPFVLDRFNRQEALQTPHMLKESVAILSEYIYGGQLTHDTRNFII